MPGRGAVRGRAAARGRGEKGVFLIALAVTIPLAAIILGAYAERSLRNLEAAQRFRADSEALHIAKGGIEKALRMLSQDSDWRSGFTDVPLAGGAYGVTVEDDSDLPSLTGLVRVRAVGMVPTARGSSVKAAAVMAATHVIRTVAGNGSDAWNGDGLPGPDTATRRPYGLAVDPAGHLWFSSDSRIRRLDKDSGIVTTPVGIGYGSLASGDDLGDGGPAAAARFMDPRGISFSPDGTRLYIADAGNGVVRLVNLSASPIPIMGSGGVMIALLPGDIERIAGGWPLGDSGDGSFAMDARFGADLNGATIDGAGILFVSDATNHRIRAINTTFGAATFGSVSIFPGFIETVYGNGTEAYGLDGAPATLVGLKGPGAVTLDAAGDIWVPLEGHNEVWRVERATGLLRHMAGDRYASSPMDGGPALAAGLGGPAGFALLPGGGWVLSSRSFHTIRRTGSDGIIHTTAGRTLDPGFRVEDGPASISKCDSPAGVAADPGSEGDFYLADRENHRIRKVTREIRIHNYIEQ